MTEAVLTNPTPEDEVGKPMTQKQIYAVMMRLSGNLATQAGAAKMDGDPVASRALKGLSEALFRTATDVLEDPEISGQFKAPEDEVGG